VPKVRDLLAALRPASGPGAATPAGVPVDRRRDAAAELAPVFDALAPVLARCRAMRDDAQLRAARRGEASGERARAVVAEARAGYETDRAAEAARLRDLAEQGARRTAEEAEAAAQAVRAKATARQAGLVTEVLRLVREDLAGQP
jgi:hypothetical protein